MRSKADEAAGRKKISGFQWPENSMFSDGDLCAGGKKGLKSIQQGVLTIASLTNYTKGERLIQFILVSSLPCCQKTSGSITVLDPAVFIFERSR